MFAEENVTLSTSYAMISSSNISILDTGTGQTDASLTEKNNNNIFFLKVVHTVEDLVAFA